MKQTQTEPQFIRVTAIICAVIAILTVSGCNSHFKQINKGEITAVNRFLIEEYHRLAMRDAKLGAWHNSEFFSHKAEEAAKNAIVHPTQPKLLLAESSPYLYETTTIYEELIAVLKRKEAHLHPDLVAKAIAKYDNFLIKVVDKSIPKETLSAIRAAYREALHDLHKTAKSHYKL
jgi:hypothetical protein